MKELLLLLVTSTLSLCASAQDYNYTFSGNLSEEQAAYLSDRMSRLAFVDKVSINYKEEKNSGEILFFLEERTIQSEDDSQFSPVDAKTILLEMGLVPGDLIELKR